MAKEEKEKSIPQHVAEQRASAPNKRLRKRRERAEFYDVFRRINMHSGDSAVCWEWRGAHGLGTRNEWRPRVAVNQKHYYVYRIVYELYTGHELAKNEVVRHSCDHSWCCNPHHMIVGTQADNVADMMKRERAGMRLFYVKRIMQMIEVGCTARYIAAKMREGYNMTIDETTVRKIRLRTLYKHVEWPWGDINAAKRRERLKMLKSV